jgi:hypothetical protein
VLQPELKALPSAAAACVAAAEADASKPAEDALAFMRRAWGLLLAAVLPLWHNPALLAAHGDKIVQVRCLPALTLALAFCQHWLFAPSCLVL